MAGYLIINSSEACSNLQFALQCRFVDFEKDYSKLVEKSWMRLWEAYDLVGYILACSGISSSAHQYSQK